MKNAMDTLVASRAPETEGFGNRKLIRPSLARDSAPRASEAPAERRERPERPAAAGSKKIPPPEQTHAENFYYQKQMQSKTPMVIVTNSGEQLHGIIEWYDKSCIKLTRVDGEPNLLIYKSCIKYMFKEGELTGAK
jgi:sRNA-binding regulator protein Hfq